MTLPVAVVWHTAAIYGCLILGLKFLGSRLLGQLTLIDLVVIVVLGSAVETSMVNGDTSLGAGLASAATLLALDRCLALLLHRYRGLRRLINGVPLLLVQDGRFLEPHLRRAGLTEADVLEAVRERGESDLENVKFAVLEPNGAINLVAKDSPLLRGKTVLKPSRQEP